jgi:hypothetical protein
MEARDIASAGAMRGMMNWPRTSDTGNYARANYLRAPEHHMGRDASVPEHSGVPLNMTL